MGLDFLTATPEERITMIVIFAGLLAVAGVLYLYDKRKKRNNFTLPKKSGLAGLFR